MIETWVVTIEAWPYQTGKGHEVDQANAGQRSRDFEIEADGFEEAMRFATHISMGVLANPHVWHAPLRGLRPKPPTLSSALTAAAALEANEDLHSSRVPDGDDVPDGLVAGRRFELTGDLDVALDAIKAAIQGGGHV